MKISEMYAVGFLSSSDLPEPRVLTISGVKIETLPGKSPSPVVDFEDETRRLILNKTNAQTCGCLLGDETDDWCGQQVELFVTPTTFDGVETLGIRIRRPRAVAAVSRVPVPQVAKKQASTAEADAEIPSPKRVSKVPQGRAIKAPPADYPAES